MDIGAFEIQIFVSLIVVLGAAFVALVCDYLKGNNEQLREKNIELRVRREEQERRALLDPASIVPQNFLEQFFAAARQAGLILTNSPASQKSAPAATATVETPAVVAQNDQKEMQLRAEVLAARNAANAEELTDVQPVADRPLRNKTVVETKEVKVVSKPTKAVQVAAKVATPTRVESVPAQKAPIAAKVAEPAPVAVMPAAKKPEVAVPAARIPAPASVIAASVVTAPAAAARVAPIAVAPPVVAAPVTVAPPVTPIVEAAPAPVPSPVVAEAKPAVKTVPAKAEKKSPADWVRPEVMARVALKANRMAVANSFEAAEEKEPELQVVGEHQSPAMNAMMADVPAAPVAAPVEVAVVEASQPVIKSNIREEIQRLKQQAKERFESQFTPTPVQELTNVAPVAAPVAAASMAQPEAAVEQPSGDLLTNLFLDDELSRVGNPTAEEEEELDFAGDDDSFGSTRLTDMQAMFLQKEIERVANLEQSMKQALQPISVLIPESPVANLSLAAELNRLAPPVVATSSDALLDQIIRASAGEDVTANNAHFEAAAEAEYLRHETANYLAKEQPRAASIPKPAPPITVGSGDSEHDALLFQLLQGSHATSQHTDQLLPEDSSLLDEKAVPAQVAAPEVAAGAETALAPLVLPVGMHDRQALNRYLESPNPLTGVVIVSGINDYTKIISAQTKAQTDEFMQAAVKLIQSTTREKDFVARISDDQWLLVCSGELGNAAQRRIDGVAEKFWDYQLRNLGQTPLNFSTGAVQVEGERLMDAFLAAQERMEIARGGKKGKETKRKVVNG